MNLIPWRRKRETPDEGGQADTSLARLRQNMDSLFDRYFQEPWGWRGWHPLESGLMGMPRTDLADTETEVTVTMELPGVDPKDVDISIAGDLLTVRGEKRDQRKEKSKNYHYVERQQGSFHRAIQLPSTVNPNKVDAEFKHGVLVITVAKRPEAKAKRINVRNA